MGARWRGALSDASRVVYGAYEMAPTVITVQGRWTAIECQRSSSTWRELAAMSARWRSSQQVTAGRPFKWHCDNAAPMQMLECDSSKVHLRLLALHVTKVCLRKRINFFLSGYRAVVISPPTTCLTGLRSAATTGNGNRAGFVTLTQCMETAHSESTCKIHLMRTVVQPVKVFCSLFPRPSGFLFAVLFYSVYQSF